MSETIKGLIAEADAHRFDEDWQECVECEGSWPCLPRRFADALLGADEWEYGVSPSRETDPGGVYSREGAQALADDCTEINPERPWVVMRRRPGVKPGPWEPDHV